MVTCSIVAASVAGGGSRTGVSIRATGRGMFSAGDSEFLRVATSPVLSVLDLSRKPDFQHVFIRALGVKVVTYIIL